MTVRLSAARRAEVLQWVQTHGVVEVNALAESLAVSSSTVRRDLSVLEEQGLLRRVHGGAMIDGEILEPRRQERAVSHEAQKLQIAARAAELIEDGTTILLTGGTTTEALLPLLMTRRDLTVVTNSLNVAIGFADAPHVGVIVLGGYLRRDELSLLGHLTRRALDDLVVDCMFAGAFGLDADGVTGANIAEAETDRQLMSAGRRLVVLADSSKFGRRGPVRLATAAQISTLVTDDGAAGTDLEPWRAAGVEVLVASANGR